ncbi:gag/pol protein [Cucumis melo var. makuwa]|uniref:Gag/pol protein n=1 Tax=Cucumis melo var. makuwa TaxID=1194695 RepID=A0A5D3DCQ4_CUCMM|nr:gag/pol protein [Cucumis melo var. makuwa]TYK21437.1 gag/pol protein [Cucumis melo var. makuwa]
MDSLQEMFKEQKEGEENIAHSRRFQKGSSSGTKFEPSSSGFKKIQKKEGGKGKHPTTTAKGKGKLSRKIVSQPSRYLNLTKTQIVTPDDDVEDRLSYKQAMNDVNKDMVKAMDLEMESMYFNSVWELVGLPKGNSKKDLLSFKYGVHLSKEQCPKTPQEVEDMRRILYASVVGSLMYVMPCTRPDICYVVGIVSRINVHPKWESCVGQLVANSKEPHSQKRGKHIKRKYDLIRKIVQRGDVIGTKIASKHNIADPFMKTLTNKVFECHLKILGI